MNIPAFSCKPGCHDCCGLVPFTDAEKAQAMALRPLEQWEPFINGSWVPRHALETFTCPFVTAGGCGIYEVRPMICRLFGAVDAPMMACPHGCGPARKLTEQQSRAKLAEVGA